MMSVIAPGSIMQLAVAFVIVLCFLVALCLAKPYKEPTDDLVALAAGFGLVMFFFLSLILKVQTLSEAVEDSLTGQLEQMFAIDNGATAALRTARQVGSRARSGLVQGCGQGVRGPHACVGAGGRARKRT